MSGERSQCIKEDLRFRKLKQGISPPPPPLVVGPWTWLVLTLALFHRCALEGRDGGDEGCVLRVPGIVYRAGDQCCILLTFEVPAGSRCLWNETGLSAG